MTLQRKPLLQATEDNHRTWSAEKGFTPSMYDDWITDFIQDAGAHLIKTFEHNQVKLSIYETEGNTFILVYFGDDETATSEVYLPVISEGLKEDKVRLLNIYLNDK